MSRRRVFRAALAVAGVWCGAAVAIDRVGTATPPAVRDRCAIVVLGARVESGGHPSPTLAARVHEGIVAARERRMALLIVSGGLGDFPPAEAAVGAAMAVDAGIEPERVVQEAQSHSTLENARFSSALIKARGLDCVQVVSDPSHLARARYAFEGEGLRVELRPVLEAPRHRDPLLRVWWTLREVPAFVRLALLR